MRHNPATVVTSAAYLLFYRRRSTGPLGPPYLQDIVNAAWNPSSEDGADAGTSSRNASPAGNGSRLGGSSRNGSSSAGTGAAVAPLRGGGSTSGITAGNLARSEAGVANLDEDEATDVDQDPPPPYDEGYADDEDAYGDITNIGEVYAPLYHQSDPVWNFSAVRNSAANDTDDVFDETASNAPELGSAGSEDLQSRMMDFPDEMGTRPGRTTPLEDDEDMPILVGEEPTAVPLPQDYSDDGPVAELVLDEPDKEEGEALGHIKMD
jgi:ubiquitin carboxyl-terminal hydrolase 4/11